MDGQIDPNSFERPRSGQVPRGGGGAGVASNASLGSLAHSGADVAVAISLAISLLAAGGIIVLRRRESTLDTEDIAAQG